MHEKMSLKMKLQVFNIHVYDFRQYKRHNSLFIIHLYSHDGVSNIGMLIMYEDKLVNYIISNKLIFCNSVTVL